MDVQPQRRRFPILAWFWRRLQNWRLRHQLAANFALHLVGIPLAVVGIVLLFVSWPWGLAAIVVGYLLQWIGHCLEGNDVGEWAAIKHLFGLPYVGIAPRWQPRDTEML